MKAKYLRPVTLSVTISPVQLICESVPVSGEMISYKPGD